MNTETEEIDRLSRAILAEARTESDEIRAQAREKAEASKRRAQEEAASVRKSILEHANQDAERLRGQAVATAKLQARSNQLGSREKLLERVFSEVRKQLDVVTKRPYFDALATQLLREALTELRVDKAEIRADDATRKALMKGGLDEVAKELKGQYTFGAPLEEGTGVVVTASNGKLRYDNTLETRLSRLQGPLRSAVYKVLMGEKV
ncbi:MAG: V-type ATP synthase subunit E family protein [Anaerolineae bacterium]